MYQRYLVAVILLFALPLTTLALSSPTISSVSRSSTGSLLYTVSGKGFVKGAKLTLGGVAPLASWQGGSTFIVFQPPKGKRGTVDVKVVNPDGGSVVKKGGFTYPTTVAAPVVKGVAPAAGSNVMKAVWGSNFESGAKVYVNNVLALSQRQAGTQYIVFAPPSGVSGSVTVEVRNPSGGKGSVVAVVNGTGGGTYGYQTLVEYTYQTPAYAYQMPGGGSPPTLPTSIPFGTTACTKYVSHSGSVNGNTAYTTIQAGVNTLSAGDTLCVAPGSYQEIVKVRTSGTANAPITIRALEQNNRPVIDGGYVLPAGNSFDGPCSEYSQEALTASQVAYPGYNAAYINPNGNLSYPNVSCTVSPLGVRGSVLVTIEASHVVWDSIDVTRSRGTGLLLGNNNGEGQIVRPCSGSECDWYYDIKFLRSHVSKLRGQGVFVRRVDGLVFAGGGVEESNNKAAYEHSCVFSSCDYNRYAWGNGLGLYAKNAVVSDNVFFHNFGEAFGAGDESQTTVEPSRNVTIARNILYDNWPGSLYLTAVDGANVWGNIIYTTGDQRFWSGGTPNINVLIGTEHGGFGTSNLVFANNIISGGSSNIRLGQYQGTTHYANQRFYNNTLLNPHGPALSGGYSPNNASNIEFVNNLVWAPGQATISSTEGFGAPNLTVHHNLWSSPPVGGADLRGAGDINPSNPGLTNPNYQPSGGAFDTNSIKLTGGSPAIGAGTPLSSVTADFFGATRSGTPDIGAYQH